MQPFDRGPARRRDHVPELAGMLLCFQNHLCRAVHGLGREFQRELSGQAGLHPRVGQRINDHEHIRRSAARKPRHRVHQLLVNNEGPAHRVEYAPSQSKVVVGGVLPARKRSSAGEHQRRSVRHYPYDPGIAREYFLDPGDRHARGDRDHKLALVRHRHDLCQNHIDHLGLHTEKNYLGLGHGILAALLDNDTISLFKMLKPFGRDIGNEYLVRLCRACRKQPLDERLGHVPAAEECDLFVYRHKASMI